jgi:NAD dependent epimerase/dehydratase family enzyme
MTDTKRVVVTGATGMIGRQLCNELIARGYAVVAFSRDPQQARAAVPGAAEYVAWSAAEDGAWASAIDNAHGVIHLAGASLFGKRWSPEYKREIIRSREVGTRGLVNAMVKARTKPRAFVSMSAVGYYGPHGAEIIDESGAAGHDFLAQVCQAWEREARPAEDLGVRTVIFRSGVVLSAGERPGLPIDLGGFALDRPGLVLATDAGAFPLLAMPFYFFAGGPILPGTQYLSWIHADDTVGLLLLALEDERARGPLNATAPTPATNAAIARTVGRVLGRPSWLPVPGFALKLALGEMADMITTGQRVVPKQAQHLGYTFKYATDEQAIRAILKA